MNTLQLSEDSVRRAEGHLRVEKALFARGFLYSPVAIEVPQLLNHYDALHLRNGILYFDSIRNMLSTADDDSTQLVVLGRMTFLYDASVDNPAEFLLSKLHESQESFHEALDWAGGRYLIIVATPDSATFYHDFFASRSVYFHKSEGIVSSHLKLLSPCAKELTTRTGEVSGPNIYRWWDLTGFEEVSSLLANHSLRISNGQAKVERYWPRGANQHVKRSTPEVYEEIVSLWRRSLDRLAETTSGIALSLTGGQDSRLMLSMSAGAVRNLTCFTYMPQEARL